MGLAAISNLVQTGMPLHRSRFPRCGSITPFLSSHGAEACNLTRRYPPASLYLSSKLHDRRRDAKHCHRGRHPQESSRPVGGAVRPWSSAAAPTSRMVRDPDHQPQSVEGLALSLPAEAWEMISWREGSADLLISRFARVRVRAAHRDFDRSVPRDEKDALSNGQLRRRSPRSSGLRPFLKTSPSTASSRSRSWRRPSSGTTRNSNRSSRLGTLRDEVCEASITMPPFASPPTPSWSPNGRGFPLRTDASPRGDSFAGPTRRSPADPDRSVTSRTQSPPCAEP